MFEKDAELTVYVGSMPGLNGGPASCHWTNIFSSLGSWIYYDHNLMSMYSLSSTSSFVSSLITSSARTGGMSFMWIMSLEEPLVSRLADDGRLELPFASVAVRLSGSVGSMNPGRCGTEVERRVEVVLPWTKSSMLRPQASRKVKLALILRRTVRFFCRIFAVSRANPTLPAVPPPAEL